MDPNSSFRCCSDSFPYFKCFFLTGAPLYHSPLAIQLFRSAEDISVGSSCHSRSVNPILRMFISFKPFNSTGATSLSNHSTVFYFEWALTHRSFPRILPDSSYFPGAILKLFSKFDVRMIYHQSYVFIQDLPNSFHRWLNRFAFDSSGASK